MPKAIISDTSCFIILANIGELELLQKVYGKVITTIEVVTEFGEPLPEWVLIEGAKDKERQQFLEMQVDKGEASAIALALEFPKSTIILDDLKARKVAESLKLQITGTVGVIVKAKKIGLIPSVKPYLDKLRKSDFRLSDAIAMAALREANEKIW